MERKLDSILYTKKIGGVDIAYVPFMKFNSLTKRFVEDKKEHKRVINILKELEERRLKEFIKQVKEVLVKNQLELSNDWNDFETIIKGLEGSKDIEKIKPLIDRYYKPENAQKLFDFYISLAESSSEYNFYMQNKNFERIVDNNKKKKRCINAIPEAEKIKIIFNKDYFGIYKHKRYEEIPTFFLNQIKSDLLESEFKPLFKHSIEVELSFTSGADLEKLKSIIRKSLNRFPGDKLKGTMKRNNYKKAFVKELNPLYKYLMQEEILPITNEKKLYEVIEFIKKLLNVSISDKTVTDSIGRN